MNYFITKKVLLILNALLIAAIVALSLTSCIPVTVRPQFDDEGLPIALPVTPTGSIAEDGQFVPVYPISSKPPTPPTDWLPMLEQGLTLALGLLVGGGAALPIINRAKAALSKATTAVSLVCNLADAQEATADPVVLAQNKKLSAQMQDAAGVRDLVKKARGK